MKPGIWFLTRLFNYKPGSATWSPRNATVWSEGKTVDMEEVILTSTEKSISQEPVSLCFVSQCPSPPAKAALSASQGGCLQACQQPAAQSLSSPLQLSSQSTTCACSDVRKQRQRRSNSSHLLCSLLWQQGHSEAQGHGDEPEPVPTYGQEASDKCIPPHPVFTAWPLCHPQMIKWSMGPLWTKARSSQLSPGSLNQHDWISQRQAGRQQ